MSLGASPPGETIGVAALHWTTLICVACVCFVSGLRCLPVSAACDQSSGMHILRLLFCGSFKQVPLSRVAAKVAPGQAAASKLQAAPAGAPVSHTVAKLQPVERIVVAVKL